LTNWLGKKYTTTTTTTTDQQCATLLKDADAARQTVHNTMDVGELDMGITFV